MSPGFTHFLFGFSAVAAVLCALMVVTRRNPIYSALYLIIFFVMIALDFVLMDATFLAFMQVLVYAGAIMVLYLFVIMLINPREEDLPEEGGAADKGIGFIVSLLFFILLTTAIAGSDRLNGFGSIPAMATLPEGHGGVAAFGAELFSENLLVFELTSILITIAVVGAVHLSLRARRKKFKPRRTPFVTPLRPQTSIFGPWEELQRREQNRGKDKSHV